MDPLNHSSQPSPSAATLNCSSNLISFNSPAVVGQKQSILQPEKGQIDFGLPSLLEVEAKDSPLASDALIDCPTSTPFEDDGSVPKFTFQNTTDGISEDPFDYIERKALQDANDPYEMVLAAAATAKAAKDDISMALNSGASEGLTMMNAAFYTSHTGLSSELEALKLMSSSSADGMSSNASFHSAEELEPISNEKASENTRSSSKDILKSIEGEEWIEDEIPPWEKNKEPLETLDDPLSDGEDALIDTVRRVSNDFPKILASFAEELDTSIVNKLKLRSPLLKSVPEFDLSPAAEPLEVPNLGLRSIDLSFLNSEDDATKKTEELPRTDGESLDEWKKQICERATNFLNKKRSITSVKPFSRPLCSIDVNSPTEPRVSTPVKPTSSALKSNLPTPKFKSRLMKPRNYTVNKENE